jgi:hypothetical protein
MKLPTILPLQSLEYQIYLILDAGWHSKYKFPERIFKHETVLELLQTEWKCVENDSATSYGSTKSRVLILNEQM